MNTVESSEHNWICFCLSGEQYVQPVTSVREIIRYSPPVPVPGAPQEFEGILNVRGEVVTIASGRRLMELTPSPPTNDWRIIILETETGPFGLVVDRVVEIVRFRATDIDTSARKPESDLIRGTILHQNGLLILTDFANHLESLETGK